MKKRLKKIWKTSRLRFYFLNLVWNYKFWLYAKKMYKNIDYYEGTNEYTDDVYMTMHEGKAKISKKRFVGFFFNNGIYLDNPGFRINDREVWTTWKKKGLI